LAFKSYWKVLKLDKDLTDNKDDLVVIDVVKLGILMRKHEGFKILVDSVDAKTKKELEKPFTILEDKINQMKAE